MVRSFLLSDQAYRKAYRAKVIVFDVGSVHRFSTRHSEVMPWSRFAPLQRSLVFKHALPALGHATARPPLEGISIPGSGGSSGVCKVRTSGPGGPAICSAWT